MRKILCPLLAAIFVAIFSVTAESEEKFLPDHIGKASFRLVTNTTDITKGIYNLSDAERTAFHENLRKLGKLLLAQPALSPPRGFNSRGRMMAVKSRLCPKAPCPKVPVAGWIEMPFLEWIEFEGKPITPPEFGNWITINVNDPESGALISSYSPTLHQTPNLMDMQGPVIFFQPPVLREVGGFRLYGANPGNDDFLILTKSEKPFFLPLRQEDYLRVLIYYWEKEESKFSQQSQDPMGDSYRKWLATLEERQTNARRSYETFKKYDAAKAEKFLRDAEKTEQELTEMFRKEAEKASGHNQTFIDYINELRDWISRQKARLSTMTQAERDAQARWDKGALKTVDSPEGTPLVIVNPDFLNLSLPRTEIQLILAFFNYRTDYYNPDNPSDNPAAQGVYKMKQTSDWAAIRALLAR
jgi:hypothetical protein